MLLTVFVILTLPNVKGPLTPAKALLTVSYSESDLISISAPSKRLILVNAVHPSSIIWIYLHLPITSGVIQSGNFSKALKFLKN